MRKSIVLGIAFVAFSLTAALAPRAGKTNDPQEGPLQKADTLTAVVLMDSLRIISYIDSTGAERPADTTLIQPVPLSGVTEFKVVLPRNQALASKW